MNLSDLGLSKPFEIWPPKAQAVEEKIDKLEYNNVKNVCPLKETIKKGKRQSTEWKTCKSYIWYYIVHIIISCT